ncbi:unnamed protein product [Caenorhabditis auriculariae]|uniref:Uncharacterized protein n=1 Tax=Caenorhabditis auriculariae TaxID=2777116 RepID=A0A8S1HFT8_9PELO|nr:unnamed protein product [Caenorhabditis auriculariae]
MDVWHASFVQIYGRPPSLSDIALAPPHIKKALEETKKKECSVVKTPTKRGPKRSLATAFRLGMVDGESVSPAKKRPPPKNCPSSESTEKTVPIKTVASLQYSTPTKTAAERRSPRKTCTPRARTPLKENQDGLLGLQFTPPRRKAELESALKPPLRRITNRTLASTTPIKSPLKPVVKRNFINNHISALLEPTPEKRAQEPLEVFEDELQEKAETEDGEVLKTKKKAQKRLTAGESTCPKKPVRKAKENFVKINLRKKTFVRGKVTAEQKRKFKRKQMFKKFSKG